MWGARQSSAYPGILILGSGFSFHNTGAFMSQMGVGSDKKNIEFQDWLIETCTNPDLSANERNERLISWEEAPSARYCHPREEHLLPLHVCCGITDSPGRLVFDKEILGKKGCAFLW